MSLNKLFMIAIAAVAALLLTGFTVSASANTATATCVLSDPGCVLIDGTPTAPAVAAPHVTVLNRHYVRVCEPTRAHGGAKIIHNYGGSKLTHYINVRAGHCKTVFAHNWCYYRFKNYVFSSYAFINRGRRHLG